MKILFSLLSLLLVNKECDSNTDKSTDANQTEAVQRVASNTIEKGVETINYTVFSRGMYKNISVSEKEIILTKSRNAKDKKTISNNTQDWKAIQQLISKIEIKNLYKLKLPSTNSNSDRGLAANLKLKISDKTFGTKDFDSNNPPKELVPLINKLLSIAEKAGK